MVDEVDENKMLEVDEVLVELDEADITIETILDELEHNQVFLEQRLGMLDDEDDERQVLIVLVEVLLDEIDDEMDDEGVALVLELPHIEVDDEVLDDVEIIEEADVNEYLLWDIIRIVDMTFLDDVNMNVEITVSIVLQVVEH